MKGLQIGTADYLTKPFAIADLMARAQALVRRSSRVAEPASLSAGDLTLDLLSRRVTREGRELKLPAREFSLPEYLLRDRGRVVSKAMILGHVCNYSFDPKTNVVDVLVRRVQEGREKFSRPS